MTKVLQLIAVVLLLNGCTVAKAVIAINKSTDHFHGLESDSRIHYEDGAKYIAEIVATHLDTSIKTVEKRQYRKFIKPVAIYVPATIESYASYCVTRNAGGCVLNERLFISPKTENTEDRIPLILTHELSHLHMEQRLGMWKWHNNVPWWFKEGLAVYVSDGGGAENVSEEEAKQAILSNEMLDPNGKGSILFPKTPSTFGLKPHMFYRQSSMFVKFLHNMDLEKFRLLIKGIEKGETLDKSMRNVYRTSIKDEWKSFITSLSVD